MCTRSRMSVCVAVTGLVMAGTAAPVMGNGDHNGDGIIDLADYAGFPVCMAGPGGGLGAGCEVFDFDGDTDVDLADFAGFQRAFGTLAVPPGMALVPAGEFQMGDTLHDEGADEQPVHAVDVDAFCMKSCEVTNQEYATALNWARTQGNLITVTDGVVYLWGTGTGFPYCSTTAAPTGSPYYGEYSQITWNGSVFGVVSGKGTYPMELVSWYGAAAYANWRSVMDGRTPCYDASTWTCDFAAGGYRLPTEAEWEKAARGGAVGRRFPWSDTDTIQHARANYNSQRIAGSPLFTYDTSPTAGFHPSFSTGAYPFTSPVGYFVANGYGLFDMAGNVMEWCNDWYSSTYYGSSPYGNPEGPATGTSRVRRGGDFQLVGAYQCRCAFRDSGRPGSMAMNNGFRLAVDEGSETPDVPPGMVLIPAGEFQMGDPWNDVFGVEHPVHAAFVSAACIDMYEVTNQQYVDALNWAYAQGGLIAVIGGVVYQAGTGTTYPYCDSQSSSSNSRITWNGTLFGVVGGQENHPIVQVSWFGAVAYCNWRSAMEGKPLCYDLSAWECNFGVLGYRLPTEAEWEKAARGGASAHRFPWPDAATIEHARANYRSAWAYGAPVQPYDVTPTPDYHPCWSSGVYPCTSPVGFFSGALQYKADWNWPGLVESYQTAAGANSYGLHDMAGNVMEWCNDWYDPLYYFISPYDNPSGPTSGVCRVLRGGSWDFGASDCRVASRTFCVAGVGNRSCGFRCALGTP